MSTLLNKAQTPQNQVNPATDQSPTLCGWPADIDTLLLVMGNEEPDPGAGISDAGELEASIREMLKSDYVSFAELSRIKGFSNDDDTYFRHTRYDTIVHWANVSKVAAMTLQRLWHEGVFHFESCSPFVYAIDGKSLRLPLATQLRQYKKPHWLPVVLRPGPAPDTDGATNAD